MRSLTSLSLCLVAAGGVQLGAHNLDLPELGNLSSSAILGWYAWHTASRTIPGLVRNFREEHALCRAQQRAERKAFQEELAAERGQRQAHQEAVAALLAEIQTCLERSTVVDNPPRGHCLTNAANHFDPLRTQPAFRQAVPPLYQKGTSMSDTLSLRPLAAEPLSRLRDLLALLAAVRGLREPLTSEVGLRAALELLARVAELLHVDPAWIQRVRLALANEHIFSIVLAIVQYVASLVGEEDDAAMLSLVADGLSLDAQSLAHWLPLVLELLTLWRQLRGV